MVDYSKWKDIEISDDEDETHPNIDTPSLFRWRHQARIERMEEAQKEKEEFEARKKDHTKRLHEAKERLEAAVKAESPEVKQLQETFDKLEREMEELKKVEDQLKQKEKVTPWNVDTISKPGFTKTVVNNPPPKVKENLTEEEKEQRMRKFIKENEKLLKQYGMLRKYDDSRRFLQENPQLMCEDTANYLVIWCINLEMEEKHELMCHVAHQCICMQYILELSNQMDIDPRACVGSFFTKIQVADPEYKKAFEDELSGFKDRVMRRAKEKMDALLKEVEEEERQQRLGPGGLDPLEVLETLPAELRECFEKQDIPLLQATIAKMDEKDAIYHMKRAVDSGLWVPEKKLPEAEEEGGSQETEEA
ncbi:hsp90 co-chaperone Cdc37 isoform X2 [Macrosteles quadrilineatus]|uniref:hsp90 co-chaperone Cdc37 isoform X2 n=1 Tax=Macrosteles quadrilineatus TaxID=74068 RepID=UPI0023E0F8B0|nr:hsp90 co-chaperone Cdc37 isoform X2 [Macrosteles quadrilineatus]